MSDSGDSKDRSRLLQVARSVGDDWKAGPYYEQAELSIDVQWQKLIWPMIEGADFSCTVELAAGHGRNSEKLRSLADRLYLVDINRENVEFLRRRFAEDSRVTVVENNGIDLEAIESGGATFVYSFDSMVHFDSDVVRGYLREFARVLRPGGKVFCHYSNYAGDPTGSYRDHPGWRNFMSVELFEHYASKEGLAPLRSRRIRWNARWRLFGTASDGFTLLEKPLRDAAGNSS